MKTTTIIIPMIALLGGCRTTKEKTHYQQHTIASGAEIQRSAYEWRESDSLARYWYYGSDASFWFHPDSGLSATGGELWVKESILHNRLWKQTQDSTVHHLNTVAISWKSDVYQAIRTGWYWIIVVLAVGALLVYRWRR
jgi:hypothetical protein